LYEINEFRALNSLDRIIITIHCQQRMLERKVSVDDVVQGIENGEIIEQYQEDTPYPSCLVLGTTVDDRTIHIVLSSDGEYIYLITVYEPSLEKWEKGFKRRRTSNHDMY